MTQLVLALDGGGSTTRVALADRIGNVQVLPIGRGVNAMDNAQWQQNLTRVFSQLKGFEGEIVHAVMGMPAYNEVEDVDAKYASFLAELLTFPFQICNDVFMARDGAFLDQPGILVLAGTGAMVVGGAPHGARARAGGWGEGFGDEGSAHWIGIEALRRASHVVDSIDTAHSFLDLMLKELGGTEQNAAETLMSWFYGLSHTRSGVAELAVRVDDWALDGDPTSQAILVDAATHLHQQLQGVERKLAQPEQPDWSYAGSVFKSKLLKSYVTRLAGREPLPPRLSPIGGGLWLAAGQAGWHEELPQNWVETIATNLKRHKF